jgi:phage gp29-like protein
MNEIATTRDGRDITRGFVDPLQLLMPADTVLQTRGGYDLKLYEELLRDDQVHATLQQRRLAVVKAEWEVEAGGDSRQDKKAAEALKANLKALDWDDTTDKMHFGVYYGYSVAECMWGRDGAQVTLDKALVRNRRRFAFDGAYRLRLKTSANPQGELLPDRKFWAYSCGADNDDEPYGLGLGHWLYWPVFFKRNGLKFWAIFLDKYGMPTASGKYPRGATAEEKTKLLSALAAIQTDAGVIIPDGMTIELIEAKRAAGADFSLFYDRMDAAITKVTLGQTLTTDAKNTGLGSSQSQTHMDVRQDLIKADADLLCQSFNMGPARWLTEWNFPGAKVPKVWRRIEEPEDLNQVAERDKTLNEMGFRPTMKYIEDTYGGERTDTGVARAPLDVARAPSPAGAQNPLLGKEGAGGDWPLAGGGARATKDKDQAVALAEGETGQAGTPVPPDTPSILADRLSREAGPAVAALLEPIRKIVGEATSLEGLRDSLFEAYPDMPAGRFTEIMEQALLAAELAGRWDVMQELR